MAAGKVGVPVTAEKKARAPRKGAPELTMRWSTKERDVVYDSDVRADRRMLYSRTGSSAMHWYDGKPVADLLDELEARGFDLKTLRFQVRRKAGFVPPEKCPDCGGEGHKPPVPGLLGGKFYERCRRCKATGLDAFGGGR